MPHPGQDLEVRVALICDLCRQVPDEQRTEADDRQRRWDEKSDGTHKHWLDANWQATPMPALLTAPKMIPSVITAPEVDALELPRRTPDGGPNKKMPFATGSSRLASM